MKLPTKAKTLRGGQRAQRYALYRRMVQIIVASIRVNVASAPCDAANEILQLFYPNVE